MKRISFCLLVLINAMAISSVNACPIKKSVKTGDAVTLTGTFGWAGEPCYEPYDNCADCAVPVINAHGITYYVNEGKTDWSSKLVDEGYRGGEEVTVTGILSEDCCYHFIDLVTLSKITQAIEHIEAAANLDISRPMYNALGVPVDESYHGIVIQNGHKFVK